jgi:ribose/xylose/arabinose/galactoside ABC-type transport system permease subunit
MGGIGSVTGTFIGVLIIGVLRKGFTLLNFSGNIFNFTLGVMLIGALIAFALLEERKKNAGKPRKSRVIEKPSDGSRP